MKKLLIIGLLASVTAVQLFAASLSTNTSGSSTALLNSGMRIRSVIINNLSGTTNTTYALYSAPSTFLLYTNNAWTNYTYSTGFQTNSYTDVLGKATLVTNNVLVKTTNSNIGTTNTYPLVMSGYITATNPTFSSGAISLSAPFGLLITNNGNPLNITITYDNE